MIKLNTIFWLITLLFSLTQCASTKEISFDNTTTYNGYSAKTNVSDVKIDNNRAFEIYFITSEKEDSIKINFSSFINDSLNNKKININNYFVVGKTVNISNFRAEEGGKLLFYELGRNFDFNWDVKQEIIINSIEDDPIKKLDINTYRIIFTIFKNEEFNYTINIYSNEKIKFSR